MSVEGNVNSQTYREETAHHLISISHRERQYKYRKKYGKTQIQLVSELITAGKTRDEIQAILQIPRPSLRRCIATHKKRS